MPEHGYALEVNVDPQGSELDQAALSTDTVLYLADASEYDPGEVVEVNGTRATVASADVDAGTVTLTAPLGAAADMGDRVYVIAGGEIAHDYALVVSLSEGDHAEIPIPFTDRKHWGPGPLEPPIPVTVFDDLTKLLEVPGRDPSLESDLVMRGGHILSETSDGQEVVTIGPFQDVNNETIHGLVVTTPNEGVVMAALSPLESDPDAQGVFQVGSTGGDPIDAPPNFPYVNVTGRAVQIRTQDPAGPGFPSTALLGLYANDTEASIELGNPGFGVVVNTGVDSKFYVTNSTTLGAGLSTTASAANMVIFNTDGEVKRSTSSRRYKQNIKPAKVDVEAALKLQPREFRSKDEAKREEETGEKAPHRVGFIAEEAADLGLAQWVDYDEEGPEAFSYGLWVVALQAIVQSQAARIDDLERRLTAVEDLP